MATSILQYVLNSCPPPPQLSPQGGPLLRRLRFAQGAGIRKVPRIPQHVVKADFSVDVHLLVCEVTGIRLKSFKGKAGPHPRNVLTARMLGLRWIAGRASHGFIRIFITGRCSMLPIFHE
jgi:hypothetical protein